MAAEKPTTLGRVLVLGAGKTGIDVCRYLALAGRATELTLHGGARSTLSQELSELESMGVRLVLGTEVIEGSYNLAIVSPGISERSPYFAAAAAHAAELIGEPEFAWRESPCSWLAITGTNGKTTTTSLAAALLTGSGIDAAAVGNIGTSCTSAVAQRCEGEWFVAELSSFQLATTHNLHPQAAALLNITPDHLAWHGSMEAYAAAKERVFANFAGDDLAVVSVDDSWCKAIATRLSKRGVRVCPLSVKDVPQGPDAAYLKGNMLVVRLHGEELCLPEEGELLLHGRHNVQNALAAAALALHAGADLESVRATLRSFAPCEHRIEPCGEARGVHFVNDSKATNTDAVEKALAAFEPGSVVVLLGGTDKGTNLSLLVDAVASGCRVAVCYGEAGERIAAELEGRSGLLVYRAEHLCDAFALACEHARPKETVLLSPACSSFDEFSGFEERGRAFKELVRTHIQTCEKGAQS